jgi:transcriptional regulator with XRE-family HTH domain
VSEKKKRKMEPTPTSKDIGQRLATLRKAKGYSQEDLAKLIDLSRSSLAQIEIGNRGMDILELLRICDALQCTLNDLVGKSIDPDMEFVPVTIASEPEMRISVPSLNWEKFREVLLYLLERCAGKPNVGETVLNKLLYFVDFNYYEIYEEQMTGATYRKLPFGPVPQRMDSLLNYMVENGHVQRIKTDYHGFPQTRYLPLQKADLELLKASEKDVIDRVIDQMGDWSAAKISEWSHKDMPWRATKEGEEISYELAFYRELPFSVRVYDDEEEA